MKFSFRKLSFLVCGLFAILEDGSTIDSIVPSRKRQYQPTPKIPATISRTNPVSLVFPANIATDKPLSTNRNPEVTTTKLPSTIATSEIPTTSTKTSTTTSKTLPTTTEFLNVSAENRYLIDNTTTTPVQDDYIDLDGEFNVGESVIVGIDMMDEFQYNVFDNITGVPCTFTKMGIILTIPYRIENETVILANLTVPINANVTGTCGNTVSELTLVWKETDETVPNSINTFTMKFVNNGVIYYVESIIITIFLDHLNFPNASESKVTGMSSKNLKLFPAALDKGMYICNKRQNVQADPILIQFHNVSVIAFNNETNFLSREEEYCTDMNRNDFKFRTIGTTIGSVTGILLAIAFTTSSIYKKMQTGNVYNFSSRNHQIRASFSAIPTN